MADYSLRSRVQRLREVVGDLDSTMRDVSRKATIRAVETAAEKTPPTMDNLSGTNTRTGRLKQHWATDSDINPVEVNGAYKTQLKNNMEYASYVNDGHRMDRHFVPGLYINPYSGMLEFDPAKDVGLVVGTRTSYVPGIFMVDDAIDAWRLSITRQIDRIIREAGR